MKNKNGQDENCIEYCSAYKFKFFRHLLSRAALDIYFFSSVVPVVPKITCGGRVANLSLESSADMPKHSRFVTFAFNSARRHDTTIETVLAFLTKRCLTNGQWCTVFKSRYFEIFHNDFT